MKGRLWRRSRPKDIGSNKNPKWLGRFAAVAAISDEAEAVLLAVRDIEAKRMAGKIARMVAIADRRNRDQYSAAAFAGLLDKMILVGDLRFAINDRGDMGLISSREFQARANFVTDAVLASKDRDEVRDILAQTAARYEAAGE